MHCCTQCPQPCSRSPPTHACTRDSWTLTGKSGQSLGGSLFLSPGSWCTQVFVCALQESISPILCKFWWPSGGVNGNLVQEGLCHTQVCCTQSLCPCGRPQLTHTSTGDTQTQIWLSLCWVSVSWYTQSLFEPSKHLWRVWGLIPNVISPLLPSCWRFSFALGHEVSYFGGIQHSPVNGCSAASCNFGVLAGEDERTSFYPAISLRHTTNPLEHLYCGATATESWTIASTLTIYNHSAQPPSSAMHPGMSTTCSMPNKGIFIHSLLTNQMQVV